MGKGLQGLDRWEMAQREFSHLTLSCAGISQMGKSNILLLPPDRILHRMAAAGKMQFFDLLISLPSLAAEFPTGNRKEGSIGQH